MSKTIETARRELEEAQAAYSEFMAAYTAARAAYVRSRSVKNYAVFTAASDACDAFDFPKLHSAVHAAEVAAFREACGIEAAAKAARQPDLFA